MDSMDILDTPRGKKIKDSRHPRAGKWTQEEEIFANNLIRAFESGTLDDCEEGKSLRSYLAKKLHCAPMRISKKFAGKCIGKLIYTKNPKQMPITMSRLDLPKPTLKVRTKITKKSLLNDEILSNSSSNYNKSTSSSSTSGDTNENSDNSDDYSADEQHLPLLTIKRPRRDSFSERIRQQTIDIAYHPHVSMTPSTSFVDFQDLSQGFGTYDPNIDPQRIDAEAEEWKDALSYFCGGDEYSIFVPPKRTMSSSSLNMY
jgi:hypothetical protein